MNGADLCKALPVNKYSWLKSKRHRTQAIEVNCYMGVLKMLLLLFLNGHGRAELSQKSAAVAYAEEDTQEMNVF